MPDLIKLLNKEKAAGEITPTAFGVSNSPSDILNPLVKVSAVEKTIQDIGNIGTEYRTPDFRDSREYEKYDVSINPIDADLDKQRAKNQGAAEQLFNSVSQAVVSEVGLGAALGLSNIFDAVGQAVFKGDGDYSNPVSAKLEEWQESFRNATPIYQENPGETFQMGDFGWWASNLPSVASSLSLLIPSMGITKGLSMVGKGLNLGKAAKAVNKALGTSKLNMALKPSQVTTLSRGAEIGTNALLSRTMENYQEARQTYNDIYSEANKELAEMPDKDFNDWLDKNPTYKEFEDKDSIAKDVASKSADVTFAEDYANLIFDVVQLHALKNIWKGARVLPSTGVLQQANKEAAKFIGKSADEIAKTISQKTLAQKSIDKFKNTLIGGRTVLLAEGSEGVEEAINYIASQEGLYFGRNILGKEVDSSFDDRLPSYLKDGHLWESAFWGVLGGVTFQTLGSAAGKLKNKVIDKEVLSEEERRKAEIYSRNSKWNEFASDIDKINKGVNIFSNDETATFESEADKVLAKEKRENDYITDLTLNAANSGNIDLLKDYISNPDVKAAMIEQNVTTEEEADSYVSKLTNAIQEVEDTYDRNILLLDNENVAPEYAQIIATENTRYDLENKNIDNNLNQINNEIANYGQEEALVEYTTPEYQNSIDLSVKVLRLRTLNEELAKTKNDKTVGSQIAKRNIEKEIDVIKKSIVDSGELMYVEYESLIKNKTKKDGSIVIDNKEAQTYIDKKIESDVDPVAAKAKFNEYKVSQAGKYSKVNNQKPKLADAMLKKSVYELQKLVNINSKVVTTEQIKTRTAQLNNTMDDARRTAIDNSYKLVQLLYDKYNTSQVFNYISKKEDVAIDGITEEEQNDLDDAIKVLDLTSETNETLYNDLRNFASITDMIKSSKPKVTVNGEAVDVSKVTEVPLPDEGNEKINVTDENTIKKEEVAIPQNPISTVDKLDEPDIPSVPRIDELDTGKDEARYFNLLTAGKETLDAIKANKEINLDELRTGIINDYIIKGYDEKEIAEQVDPIIRLANRRRNATKNSTINEDFQSAIDEVVLRNSEIIESPTEEYLGAIENYVKKYSDNIGFKQPDGKYYVNLESLMRYTKEQTNDAQLANLIFNNIRDILIDQSNRFDKYVLTDKQEIERLSRTEFMANINKTSTERLNEKIAEISKQRVDIYSQEETPEYNEALQKIEAGQTLDYEVDKGVIHIKSNNVRIGQLPIPTINSNGSYQMYNDGWKYEINEVNGKVESPLKNLFKEWLVTRADEATVIELNSLINELAYNTKLSDESKAELLNKFANNKEVINARTNGFIASNSDIEQLLDGLASIYGYVGQQFEDIDRYKAINTWFDKLNNSYKGVIELSKGNKQVKVADISDGEAIILDGEQNIPVQEAIVGFNTKVHKIMATMTNNVITKAGSNETYSFQSGIGSTFVFLPNRSGNNTYAQAYPTKLNDESLEPQVKDMVAHIKTSITDMFNKKANNDISFEEFSTFINSLFSNNKNRTSLLGKVIVTERPGSSITISVKDSDHKMTFFNKNVAGNTSKQVGISGNKYIASDNKQFADTINAIIDSSVFNISFGGIKSDSHINYPFNNNSVLSKKDGVFKITIGDRSWQFDSFNDFLMGNNLVKVHIGKTEDGTSNFRRIGSKPGSNQILNIQIEDSTNPPVEVMETPEATTSISDTITSIINNKRTKNKGSAIIETLTDKRTKDLFKRLGVVPENVIFVEEIKDRNGNPVNAQVNTRTGIVTITNKFLAMVETDPSQAFRKLIHEGLHNQIAKDGTVLSKIDTIYSQFAEHVNKFDSDNKQIARYKFDGLSKEIQLEEFLVESLTSYELANYLNNIEVSELDNIGKKKTLFQKIMEALMDIMGIDINDASLYKQELLALGLDNVIIENNEVETVIAETQKATSETEFNVSATNEGFELDDVDDLFNSVISEYNKDNRSPNIATYINGLPLSQQADIATLLADGKVEFTCA